MVIKKIYTKLPLITIFVINFFDLIKKMVDQKGTAIYSNIYQSDRKMRNVFKYQDEDIT